MDPLLLQELPQDRCGGQPGEDTTSDEPASPAPADAAWGREERPTGAEPKALRFLHMDDGTARYLNKIVKGDCRKVLQGIKSASIDLVVTDPPYGMNYRSRRFGPIRFDRDRSWFRAFIAEAYRVLKEDTHIYVFANDHSLSTFRAEMAGAGFRMKRTLVWLKDQHGMGDLRGDYAARTEFILFAHKGRRHLNGRRDTNVLHFDRFHKPEHPTEKPEGLVRFLIAKSSATRDIVLDPFAGSGTTCVAARSLGRRYIGIEIDARWVRHARARLAGGQERLLRRAPRRGGRLQKKSPNGRAAGPWESVLLREKDAGGRAIGFGNDPDPGAVF